MKELNKYFEDAIYGDFNVEPYYHIYVYNGKKYSNFIPFHYIHEINIYFNKEFKFLHIVI